MGFDFAKRRAELQAAMDLNALKQADLQNDMSALLKEFRQLELQEREARARVKHEPSKPLYTFKAPPVRKPTGIMK